MTRPDTASDDVERVARAIYQNDPELYFYERPGSPPGNQFLDWEHASDFGKRKARKQATAAIAAMPKSDGLPTEAMIEAGANALKALPCRDFAGIMDANTTDLDRMRRRESARECFIAMRDAALTQGGEVG